MYPLSSVSRAAALLFVLLSFCVQHLFAQAPVIKYTTPHTYKINTPITALAPANTGGAVPATIYGQVSTIAGGGTLGYFSAVTGVAVDPSGNIFFADWDNNKIYKLTPSGNLSLFAGNGNAGWDDGQGTTATLYETDAIVSDAAGNLYISDQLSHLIRKITPGGLVTTIAGTPHSPGFANGTGSAAMFNNPRGLAIDGAGNIYVADQGNNMIRKITPAGVVTTYAGSGAAGSADGTAASATFNTPTAVGLDAAGNLYVSDAVNNVIRKITPGGVVSTFATGFNFPRELRVDGTGNVYVAEQYSNTVKRISPAGVVTIVAGGSTGATNGIGTAASFNGPLGLALDGKGNLFLGENLNNDVRKIVISGYTIDKALPAGLVFDPKTGIISGTPTVLSLPQDYVITAYNGTGSNSTTVNIQVVQDITLQPSIIDFPIPTTNIQIDADNILHPGATSNNTETPITYTSSNPDVAYVGADGQIHVIAPGITTITAYQEGNDHYLPASPVQRIFTIKQEQVITFPDFPAKSTCSVDFPAGATSSNSSIPLTYFSSNPAVATVSATGIVHIVSAGTTTITVSQSGNNLYNAAVPQSQVVTVAGLVTPSISITNTFSSCEGMSVTYTTAAVNAGNNPTYQWQVNGQNSGDNSATYTSSSLHTGDVITCVVVNNDGCMPVSSPVSSQTTIIADPYVTLNLTITSSVNGTVPVGTPITFKAIQSTNASANDIYQWHVNGQNAGSNSPNFTTSTLLNGDVVTCTLLSGGKCILNSSVSSNAIMASISITEKIVIPNTFTPNSDGYNDTWYIPGLLPYNNCTVNIYNRYGTMVYRSVGYQQPWDGTTNGKPVPSGVYYYVIDIKNGSGKLAGPVTILR